MEGRGIPCWIAPRNIDPGSSYASQIVNAIRQSSALVLLASEYTNASGHVSNEVSLAFDNQKTIIPFKLQDIVFSDEYLYYLGRKHWIDAFRDFPAGLESLYQTLCNVLPDEQDAHPVQPTQPAAQAAYVPASPAPVSSPMHVEPVSNRLQNISRSEIVTVLTQKMEKFSYCLAERFQDPSARQAFERAAEATFEQAVRVTRFGRVQMCENGVVDKLVSSIKSADSNASVSIYGLPGSAKNMLLQLAYFRLADDYAAGRSGLLPCYIAANYFEKGVYTEGSAGTSMKERIRKELDEFITYVQAHPGVKPVVFVDGVREHIISSTAPENVFCEVLRELSKYRRVVTVDTGLIKNRQRIKKVIPITGEQSGWVFQTLSVDISDHTKALRLIEAVFAMYGDNGIEPEKLYQTLVKLRYTEVDIFVIRMVTRELTMQAFDDAFSAAEMYERMALRELEGDERQLCEVAGEIFRYVFDEWFDVNESPYRGKQWSLVHKHHTYMEYLIAYHFAYCIRNYQGGGNTGFFRTMLTAGENMFLVQMLRASYPLQEALFSFVTEHYDQFDSYQKGNGAYWLGRLNSKSLTGDAVAFLRQRFEELRKLVKGNEDAGQENLDRQFLFRAVCTGLLFQGKAIAMDEYLCTVITNDVANALNRGATIEYYGDAYQMAANDTYYLDTNPSIGVHAINALFGRVDDSLNKANGKFSENNLVTLTTILQTRIQRRGSSGLPDIEKYVQRAIYFLELYQKRPQHTSSGKIEFYLRSVLDDFRAFLAEPSFDISKHIYDRYRGIKDVKRQQWVSHDIDDPESVSEHTYSAWLMAMLFLPEDIGNAEYKKREVLDMLLIHDLAEAELGDQVLELDEPSKELKVHNEVLRKLFVKGTYPQVANLTYYYNIWTGYYNGTNINARIARDVNTIQTSYAFFEYYSQFQEHFSDGEVLIWNQNQEKLSTAVILGLGGYGTEMLKALSWFGQMDGCRLMLTAVDLQADAAGRFTLQCPELMSPARNGTFEHGEAQYAIAIHAGVDALSERCAELLAALPNITYLFIALGNDQRNIEAAVRWREFCERRKLNPKIQPVVYNSASAEMLNRATNFRGASYRIHCVGSIRERYTEQTVLNPALEAEALARHLLWGKEDAFWRYEFNYRSSAASALHRRMKLLRGIPGADLPPEERTTEDRDRLRLIEHRRWNAYMRSEGYSYSGSREKGSRNDLAKLHNDLIPFDLLTESEKAQDDV